MARSQTTTRADKLARLVALRRIVGNERVEVLVRIEESEARLNTVFDGEATEGLVYGPVGALARFVAVARHLESAALRPRARLPALPSVLHAAPEPHAQLHWLGWIRQ